MSDDSSVNSNEDKQMDKLLRSLREESDDRSIRPSEASIGTFLMGAATGSQKHEIRKALIRSAGFRQELLAMAKDIESLAAKQTLEEFDRATAPDAPSLESILAREAIFGEEKESAESWIAEWIVPRGLNKRLGTLLRFCAAHSGRRIAAVSLVGAAVLALIIVRTARIDEFSGSGQATASWTEVTQVDAGYFVSNVTRTSDGSRTPAPQHATHLEAAVAEFSRLVRYEGGEYAFDSVSGRVVPEGAARMLLLRLVDGTGSVIAEFEGSVPLADNAGLSIRVWALSVPSGALRSIDMSTDTVSAPWNVEMGSRGSVTFTYGADSAFAATAGSVFEFRSDCKTD
jgi:hypothetical protein